MHIIIGNPYEIPAFRCLIFGISNFQKQRKLDGSWQTKKLEQKPCKYKYLVIFPKMEDNRIKYEWIEEKKKLSGSGIVCGLKMHILSVFLSKNDRHNSE